MLKFGEDMLEKLLHFLVIFQAECFIPLNTRRRLISVVYLKEG